MEITKAGIILNTENYAACRQLYASVLELPVLDEFGEGEDEITIFSLGDVYLMVEHGGSACLPQKSEIQCSTKFRFNVPDVKAAAEKIARKGVQISVLTHVWGVTAEFFDPDGNRCALRSDAGFSAT